MTVFLQMAADVPVIQMGCGGHCSFVHDVFTIMLM